jgi:signal transduction histidine kinase
VLKAAGGTLVTNQIVSAQTTRRDEPFPVLLNFIPVEGGAPAASTKPIHEPPAAAPAPGAAGVRAVTVTGEVMAEPMSWVSNQTQRHRMEALGRMTMGVAHDLNNLLSGLLGHLELLRDAPDLTQGEVRESLGTIEQAAEDGAALIGKLQRYIREDTEVHFEPVDLQALMDDCIALTQPYWHNEPRRQGIQIGIDRALEAVPPILGSPSELREVLINLILNAVQAMPRGGRLHFASFVEEGSAEGAHVVVEIGDTGIGMAEETQARIFEPLFTTKSQGTGMGLAASYGIVQEHSGDIEVDSRLGEGTVFRLRFPLLEGEATPPPAPADAEADAALPKTTKQARVLVVDDEEMVRSVAIRLLQLRGHEVEGAASGREALDHLEAAPFDLVFTDYGMPEMNGAELARAIRDGWPGLPVVLVTGYTETHQVEHEVEAVIPKPFRLEDLDASIRKLV